MTEVRVKITDPRHVYAMAHASGFMDALGALQDLPATLRQTPGMALAIATISADANNHRAAVIGKNLVAISRAGHDITNYRSVIYDPNTAELICEFHDADFAEVEES